jgi:zinc transport system permease protein
MHTTSWEANMGTELFVFDWLGVPFMQRALAIGILLASLGGYFGSFVVQRKMSFLGAGLAHAAFGGIAAGLLVGVEPLWIALPFTVLVAAGIHWIRQATDLADDTAIGIFFSLSVALGVLFLSLRTGSTMDAASYLFGSILAVSASDLWLVTGLAFCSLLTLPRMWGRWAYATFDDESAQAQGLNTGRDSLLLTVFVALVIVVSIKMVGILLVSAWLVIPPAAARLRSRRFSTMMLSAIVLSVVATVVGLHSSWVFDIPSGAAIVLSQIAAFMLYFSVRRP